MVDLLNPKTLYPMITGKCKRCGREFQYRQVQQKTDRTCDTCQGDHSHDMKYRYSVNHRNTRDPSKWATSPSGGDVNILDRQIPDDGEVTVRASNLACFKLRVKRLPPGQTP